MVTLNNLINGRNDVMSFDKKVSHLKELLHKVIRPVEEAGYDVYIVRGLLYPQDMHKDKFNLRMQIDHIYGYGCDISTGSFMKDNELAYKLYNREIDTGVKYVCIDNGYIHVSIYDGKID